MYKMTMEGQGNMPQVSAAGGPGKLSEEQKQKMIAEGTMAKHEREDAKKAYQSGQYGHAAKEMLDAAKYSAEHAGHEVKQALTGDKAGSTVSGTTTRGPTTALSGTGSTSSGGTSNIV